MEEIDALLAQVLAQAHALGIPVGKNISPHVSLNARAVSRFGCCTFAGEACRIEVSQRLLAAGAWAVRETLAHEVLHTCRGCRDHGERWKGYAARMNAAYGYHISRTGTWEALGLAEQKKVNHLLVCQGCGREFKRARASSLVRNPERYRCKCGGKLVKKF